MNEELKNEIIQVFEDYIEDILNDDSRTNGLELIKKLETLLIKIKK